MKTKEAKRESHLRVRMTGVVSVLLNVLLLFAAVRLYNSYNDAYEETLREENLGNIANINQSAAVNVAALFDSWDVKLEDIAVYTRLNDLTVEQMLAFISDTNTNADWYFQLVGGDSMGWLAGRGDDGSFAPLDYSHSSYNLLHKVFEGGTPDAGIKTYFAPEYTDSGETASKFFAKYIYLPLRSEDGAQRTYTLLLATRSKKVLDHLNSLTAYDGQSTVLIDADGNYIVSSKDYKSTNLLQYLYVYNDLSLDEKTAIHSQMKDSGSGELYYKNAGSVVEDCLFRYDRMEREGWYCVTCVPLSSFREPAFNINYLIHIAVCFLGILIIDVSWLQGMNRRLRQSVQREKEASAAKGSFMSRMSHEIRTPLNAVIGYNTIAQSALSSAENETQVRNAEMKVMDCLTKSAIASKHLLTIINDVLDMSAIESGKICVSEDNFDFKGLITSLTTVFYSQAKNKSLDFEVKFDGPTDEWFVGDQMRVNQILTNLLSNAIKFTPTGGTVALKITQPETEADTARIRFQVIDTGIGMSREYLKRIWTPFEQEDASISRRFGGSGLGLSITKSLVDLMGGDISVSSTPGEGSTFTVELSFGRVKQPGRTETYDFSGVNALAVDDDPAACDYIRLLFNRCGAKCASVTSGKDALKAVVMAKERGETYSLCLMDWRMPGMDGIETIRRIRDICGEEMPVVVLTAYDYSELADKAAEEGVTRFISKPLFQSSLFDLMANVCGTPGSGPMEKNKSYDFSGKRVLLAEDNAMNMEIAGSILESAGLMVDGVWNGKEALDSFEASQAGYYKAILMDVHMPVMDGHEASRAIRASHHSQAKTIPIIAMTADAFAENVAEALASGMNGHISKPIDITSLFETLSKYI